LNTKETDKLFIMGIKNIKKWILEHQKIVSYIVIGGLTTIVSYVSFYLFSYIIGIEVNIANIISVIAAVIFAYVGNKFFVFHSHCETSQGLWREMLTFFLSRAATIVLEIAGVFILATLIGLGNMLSKVLASIIVVILNYVISNRYVFRKNEEDNV